MSFHLFTSFNRTTMASYDAPSFNPEPTATASRDGLPIATPSLTGPWHLRLPILGFTVLFAITIVCFADDSSPTLRQRHLAQQKARAMTAELVSNILDIQLRQFAENKLDKLPAYADIELMRRNLDRLVEQEMQSVVDLLAKAELATESGKKLAATEARAKGRAVVAALLAEQQRLRRRMRLAKIAAHVRQLIELETRVLIKTQQLPERPPTEREQVTLECLEDQRDTAVLQAQLVATLREVVGWEGSIATAATKGLELLTKLKVDEQLKNADAALSASRFPDAQKAEEAAIQAWKALLEVIEQAQGLEDDNRDVLAKDVEDLLQQQSQLRDETKSAKLDDESKSEKLAEQQHAVHEQLNDLAEKLAPNPSTESLAKQAANAAFEAEANLFEGKQEPAVKQQEQVMEALEEISKSLDQAAQQTAKPSSEQSAENSQPKKSKSESDTAEAKPTDLKDDAESGKTQKSKRTEQAQKAPQKQKGESDELDMQVAERSSPSGQQPQTGARSGAAANSAARSVESEPWFARLPPDVQKSIQARSRRAAPRGYEERL
jgi:hypothetical protein